MAVEVDTKDCTALTDAEISEMADLCAEGPRPFEVGLLSKQAEEWVLVSTARQDGKLKGFLFSTLERIGGTPAVLIGMGAVSRTSKRDTVLRGLMHDQLYKALMAFPDEDVLIGAQFAEAGALEAFRTLDAVVPRPGYDANGEDRAWGRRLAKRFALDGNCYEARAFRVTGDHSLPRVLDHESLKPDKIAPEVVAQFAGLDAERGDSLIVFAWAMVEDLEKLR
ncbi:MAG: hypothetical protein OEU32_02710 [Acidimicrobiia bacterium]|nr:hypothetical protein [Acidimicrobiia bacterium]